MLADKLCVAIVTTQKPSQLACVVLYGMYSTVQFLMPQFTREMRFPLGLERQDSSLNTRSWICAHDPSVILLKHLDYLLPVILSLWALRAARIHVCHIAIIFNKD
jgi:hypothetical protein